MTLRDAYLTGVVRLRAIRSRRVAAALGAVLCAAAAMMALTEAVAAKTPGRTHCFLGHCHRVLTLAETRLRLGRTETLRASFYDNCARDRFNPCQLTSSGEEFRPGEPDNAASPIYPDGTMLLLFYPETGVAAVVRVNNAGPYHSSRLIDVSAATASALGFRAKGVADIEVRVIAVPRADEAMYQRRRRYWPVHGPIGMHASIAAAHAALVQVAELPSVPARADAAVLMALPKVVVVPEGAHAGRSSAAIAAAPEVTMSLADPPSTLRATAATVATVAIAAAATAPLGERLSESATQPRQIAVGAAIELAVDVSQQQRTGPVAMAARADVRSVDETLLVWAPAAARRALTTTVRSTDALAEVADRSSDLARLAPAIARTSGVAPAATPADYSDGVLATLRMKARRGVTPGRLPEISVVGAVTWLRETAVALAQRARSAARSAVRSGARLASLTSEGAPGQPSLTRSMRAPQRESFSSSRSKPRSRW
ncbi:MAG: septal ring lytic transglycosylase RlpA family protein [Hyphomicrobium sp.]